MLRDALVVGVSSYQYLPALNAPAQDAEAIAHQLEAYGDFRVTRLPEIVQSEKLRVGVKTPVSLAELESALVKLFKPKGDNIPHAALFYFSGHGLQKEAGICEGYLASSDVNPAAHFYGLSLFWLRRLLQESPVRQRIVLLDCCHSGEILNFLEADPGAKSGTDRLFMAASREYESAYESLNGQYSVLTQALLDGLDPRRLPSGIITNHALTDWVSNALKRESQQPLFENSGSEIVLTRCQNPIASLNAVPVQDICPYRGLEPFDARHAEYFFGREQLTDHLLDKLRISNFLAVVGASGSGKSSLVKAGLTYKLQRGQLLSPGDRWEIRVMTPTDQPFVSLANAFVNAEAMPVERAEQLRRAEMLLTEGVSGLTHLIRASLMSQPNARLVLIIDQFEEVFTLCQGVHAEVDRHRFFNCLLAAQRELGDRFNLVIALRADFFSKCSFYKELAEQIEHNLVMVTPLNYEQIKASILKPAAKVGLVCEPNLVYNILLDIVGAPGELPLLQYTLLELWHRRQQDPNGGAPRLTLDAYADLGGVRGTLQKRADEIFYSLSLEEQRVAKRIFIALTQLGEGTEDTRRRVLKSELVAPQFTAHLVEQVLEKLIVAKLVVTNQIAPVSGQQEQIDQRFANVSTALRLAQVMRKSAHSSEKLGLERSLPLPATLTGYSLNVNRLSHTVNLRSGDARFTPVSDPCQETVDIAHEALIRNWTLLRSWLDENREMLRRQRKIERAAREWNLVHQPRFREYLLYGNRLLDAEDFWSHYPEELSALAQQYITTSREEYCRTKREFRLLRVSIPCTLMVALGVTFTQYQTATSSQAEKDFQRQLATSRQWSAIAQSILQEPDGDPTTALLISRLAAAHGRTYEAEASLRLALQTLHLQTALPQVENLQHLAFSPDTNRLAAIDQAGAIHLWSVANSQAEQVWQWNNPVSAKVKSDSFSFLDFSNDGSYLAAVANHSAQIRVWAIASGKLHHQLTGFSTPIAQVAVHRESGLIAASSGNRVKIWHLATGQMRAELTYRETVQRLAFSSDGTRVLVAGGSSLMLAQVAHPQRKQVFAQVGQISAIAVSPNQRWIAIVNDQSETWLWEVSTGKSRQLLSAENLPRTAASTKPQIVFSPNGEQIAIVNSLGQMQVVHLESGQRWQTGRQTVQVNNQPAQTTIAFSPDSKQLVLISAPRSNPALLNHSVSIREATTGRELGKLQGHSSPIKTMQFNDDGSLIATASTDGSVYLWSIDRGGELRPLKLPQEPIQWAGFNATVSNASNLLNASTAAPEPEILAFGQSGALQRWELTQHISAQPTTMTTESAMPAITPSETMQLFSSLQQLGKRLWLFGTHFNPLLTAESASPVDVPPATALLDTDGLSAKGLSTTGLSATGLSATLANHLAGVKSMQFPAQLIRQPSANVRLSGVAASSDGKQFAIANSVGSVEIWQQHDQSMNRYQLQAAIAPSAPPAAPNQTPSSVIHYLAFSRDGQKLVGVGADKTLRVWEVRSRRLLHQLSGHEALVEQAHFSSNGKQIVSASWDRSARIWDVASGKVVATLTYTDVITSAQFNPNNQRVLITSLDGTARIIEAATGTVQVILAGHRGALLGGEFSPDGQLVVTASVDGTARLWDANTGVERTILRPIKADNTQEPIKQAFFSPDGQYVATLGSSGTLHLWAATWQSLLELAHDRSLRQLKPEECLRHLRLAPNACPTLTSSSQLDSNRN